MTKDNIKKESQVYVQANVDKEVVERAKEKLACYGLDCETAINMFFHQIDNEDRFPFTPRC